MPTEDGTSFPRDNGRYVDINEVCGVVRSTMTLGTVTL